MSSIDQQAQLPIFVYGTLKWGEPNYARHLAGRTLSEQPAMLAGAALFTQGPYPFLVRAPDLLIPGDDTVSGRLVTIRPSEYAPVLAALDDLEGYVPGGLSNLYEREQTTVLIGATPRPAMVYVAGLQALALIRAGQMRRIAGGEWRSGA